MDLSVSLIYFHVFFFDSIRLLILLMFFLGGLLQKARIQIWLFEQRDLRIEGRIIVCSSSYIFSRVYGLSIIHSISYWYLDFANKSEADIDFGVLFFFPPLCFSAVFCVLDVTNLY